MTLHARVSRVDDFTGELAQALAKLERGLRPDGVILDMHMRGLGGA